MNISQNTSSSKGTMPMKAATKDIMIKNKVEELIQKQNKNLFDKIIENTQASLEKSDKFLKSFNDFEIKPLLSSKFETMGKYIDFLDKKILIFTQLREIMVQMGFDEEAENITKTSEINTLIPESYYTVRKNNLVESLQICHALERELKLSKNNKYSKSIQNANDMLDFAMRDIIDEVREDYNNQKKSKIWAKDLSEFNILESPEDIREQIKILQKYSRAGDSLSVPIQRWMSKLEKFIQKATDELMLLCEQDEKGKQHTSPAFASSHSKQKFTPAQKDKENVLKNISEMATPLEDHYNQKLYTKWKEYFKGEDYRQGRWSGKKEVSIPLMGYYVPQKMQFTISPKETKAHLKKRHQELIQELSKTEKKDIKDEDNFEFNISGQSAEIHNLISELAFQLLDLDKETFIYKSFSYKNSETGEKIDEPAIMMRGKNQKGDMMLSAWGLYEAEKQDRIKLHLLSYYPDTNLNRTLPKNAMKISKFSDEVDQEIEAPVAPEAPVAQPLDDAELIALFKDNTSLKKESEQKFKKIKNKDKKKKS